ncbi:MAG TPA: hypothetical protein VKE40_25595 [Gemmataceae bacterium]|nr:hypothetical protein [Gemmataceae bacterium]
MKPGRRVRWICLGLLVLAVSLFTLSAWRFTVFMFGPEEALLRFEPSPLLAEYDRLTDRREELEARAAAGDPTVTDDDVDEAYEAQLAMYRALVADDDARWATAQRVELCVSAAAGLAGGLLILAAIGLFVVWGLASEQVTKRDSASKAEPPPDETRRERSSTEPERQLAPPAPGTSINLDGWVTCELEFVRFLVEHPPPRPHGYCKQLRLDARYWKVLFMWLAGVAPLALGLAIDQWLLILGGLVVIGGYVLCLVRAVANFRHSPVALGVVKRWDTIAKLSGFDTAVARISSGQEIRVASCRSPVPDVTDPDMPAEVLVLHQPTAKFSMVIAVRPIPDRLDN